MISPEGDDLTWLVSNMVINKAASRHPFSMLRRWSLWKIILESSIWNISFTAPIDRRSSEQDKYAKTPEPSKRPQRRRWTVETTNSIQNETLPPIKIATAPKNLIFQEGCSSICAGSTNQISILTKPSTPFDGKLAYHGIYDDTTILKPSSLVLDDVLLITLQRLVESMVCSHGIVAVGRNLVINLKRENAPKQHFNIPGVVGSLP